MVTFLGKIFVEEVFDSFQSTVPQNWLRLDITLPSMLEEWSLSLRDKLDCPGKGTC